MVNTNLSFFDILNDGVKKHIGRLGNRLIPNDVNLSAAVCGIQVGMIEDVRFRDTSPNNSFDSIEFVILFKDSNDDATLTINRGVLGRKRFELSGTVNGFSFCIEVDYNQASDNRLGYAVSMDNGILGFDLETERGNPLNTVFSTRHIEDGQMKRDHGDYRECMFSFSSCVWEILSEFRKDPQFAYQKIRCKIDFFSDKRGNSMSRTKQKKHRGRNR